MALGLGERTAGGCRRCREIEDEESKKKDRSETQKDVYANGTQNTNCEFVGFFSDSSQVTVVEDHVPSHTGIGQTTLLLTAESSMHLRPNTFQSGSPFRGLTNGTGSSS